ncbi:MAG: VIT1/CCC1 transporter family protein [Actinomycetia bacterium]|nr:VIT1/CCC1 transporter family protein [Actinomycetes bacterium]
MSQADTQEQTDHPSRPPYRPHVGENRPYLRDVILGVNDGLVSILLLVAGLVGGQLGSAEVLLGGLVGALAGAVSMALGEYLATKSQEEVWDAELLLEDEHIKHYRDEEAAQLYELLEPFGLDGEDLEEAVRIFSATDQRLKQAMAVLEFGVVESERRSPYRAGWMSGGFFLAGSALPLAPFLFSLEPNVSLLWSVGLTFIGLFIVGWTKTRITYNPGVRSGLENMLIAGAGATLAWWVGRILDISLS